MAKFFTVKPEASLKRNVAKGTAAEYLEKKIKKIRVQERPKEKGVKSA